MVPVFAIGSSSTASAEPTSKASRSFDVSTSSGTNMEAGFLTEIGRRATVFQTGLMYKEHQFKIRANGKSGTGLENYFVTGDVTFKYLTIPLMVKSRLRLTDGVRLAGRVGGELAFFMSGKSTSSTQHVAANGQTVTDFSKANESADNISSFNTYFTIGAGPEFRIAQNQNIRVEAFYERMLLKMNNDSDSDLKLQAINAMISYAFAF
jgi:hypothetical protein